MLVLIVQLVVFLEEVPSAKAGASLCTPRPERQSSDGGKPMQLLRPDTGGFRVSKTTAVT